MDENKTYNLLFYPLNSSGHINGCHGFVKRILELIKCKVFVASIGPLYNNSTASNIPEYTYITVDVNLNNEKFVNINSRDWKQEDVFRKSLEMVDNVGKIGWFYNCVEIIRICHSGRGMACYSEEFERIIKEYNIDIIVTDSIATNAGISAQSSVPWISFGSCNPYGFYKPILEDGAAPLMYLGNQFYTKEERIKMKQDEPEKWQALLKFWIENRKKLLEEFNSELSDYNRYAKLHNAPLLEVDRASQSSKFMNVYMYPKDIDYTLDDDIVELPPNFYNCESTLTCDDSKTDPKVAEEWRARIDKLKSLPGNANKPLLFFSLGSLASANKNIMQCWVDKLASDSKRIYIVSKGCNGDQVVLNESNMIGEKFVPQVFILQQVDAAIIHGGNNSVTECFYYGVPFIALPAFSEQADNAQRVEDLRIGRRLDLFKSTYEDLMVAINDIMLNNELRSRVKAISEGMRSRDECGKVARLAVDKIIDHYKKFPKSQSCNGD